MPRLSDLSIKAKLSAGFGLSLALIFGIGVISLLQLWNINAITTRVTEIWLPQVETLGEIKRTMAEHFFLAKRRTTTTNFRQVAADSIKMEALQAELDDRIRRFTTLANRPAEIELLAQFGSEWRAYRESLEIVLTRIDAGDPGSAQIEFDAVTTEAYASAVRVVDNLFGVARAEGLSAAKSDISLLWIAAVLIFAALTVGGTIRWVSLNVSKPILRISDAMRRLTAGDESAIVSEGLERKDEIGVLANAVAGYRASLDRIRQLADEANRERRRLDTALTNMLQGLCMFDADTRLVIFNQRFLDIFQIPPGKIVPGMSIQQVMKVARAAAKDPDAADQQKMLAERAGGTAVITLTDDRSIAVSHRPMSGGGFVTTFEDITERLLAEEKIRHLAQYDALTDLPNRVTFYERMEAALGRMRRSEFIAVLSVDLDHFKAVNDMFGHPVGDRLLQAAAERMRSCVRKEDIVARLGGDEFAIVQAPSEQPTNITALVTRLIEVVGAPYDIDGNQVVAGISVGIALAPSDGDKPDVLMKNADLALYRAKADGGGVYRFFEMEMDARMQARRALELDLRKAVVSGEFELYYQPIIDVKTKSITSCEALIRWHHPKRGMVLPLEFIPVAEETGLIIPIGEWVLRQACTDAARWPPQVAVSVNLSPAQFKSRNLVQNVIDALASAQIPAERVELEITELVLLHESEGAFAVLRQLRELGIKVSMDDFGTGYSSLGYLRSFPFDKIKIDRSFIRDLPTKEDSVAIVRAVVGLSSSLGITTIAEGVETQEQLARVTSEGCNEVQGFLFSPPRPAAEVEELLEERVARVEGVA